jgi:hypothetical protein
MAYLHSSTIHSPCEIIGKKYNFFSRSAAYTPEGGARKKEWNEHRCSLLIWYNIENAGNNNTSGEIESSGLWVYNR